MTDRLGEVALPALTGPVEVVGAGLIGTSVALVCSRLGIEVVLRDTSGENLRTAYGLGGGRAVTPADRPQLVVVAVPPAAIADVIVDALRRTDAVVTDVGSVKAAPLSAVSARVSAGELARYVGSHPMAGSERSGPLAASAALFDGRPWAVTPHPSAHPDAVGLVESLVLECGAAPLLMDPAEHDRAVARISHLPHLAAVLVAGRLAAAPAEHLALSGQGVRDVTRVAASDPDLWQQILEANSEAVLDLLGEVRADLDALMTAFAGDAVTRPRRDPHPWQRGHRGDPRQARRTGPAHPIGLRGRARPSRRAGAAVRRRRRDRRQHRGRPHRPRPGPPGRSHRAGGRAQQRRAPAGRSRIPRVDDSPVIFSPVTHADSSSRDRHRLVIAVDGTSGSGKSSTSRGVADRLGLRYLDTGAMFRAMTWWLLREGIDVHDPGAVAAASGGPPSSPAPIRSRPPSPSTASTCRWRSAATTSTPR